MPYRGPEGFSWRTMDGTHQNRAIAAVVLLGVGWGIGFFAGRMSAWLFPVAQTSTAALSGTMQSAAAPGIPPAIKRVSRLAPPAEKPQAEAAAPPDTQTQTDRSTTGSASGESRVVLVNPDWKQGETSDRTASEERELRDLAGYSDTETGRERLMARDDDPPADSTRSRTFGGEALARCQRQYSSFRESDGTYQPYGRRGRELCPHLYQAYGRLEERR